MRIVLTMARSSLREEYSNTVSALGIGFYQLEALRLPARLAASIFALVSPDARDAGSTQRATWSILFPGETRVRNMASVEIEFGRLAHRPLVVADNFDMQVEVAGDYTFAFECGQERAEYSIRVSLAEDAMG